MRAPTTVLRVRNWDAFQHYKDRDPTWIKAYCRLLDDADFLGLPEAAQAQLVKLWLLASRSKNQIRDDATFLKHALHTNKLYVELLVTGGFLERGEPVEEAPVIDRRRRDPADTTEWGSRYVSEAVRANVLARTGGKCAKCGTTERIEIDHIVPVSKGGTSEESNLQPLCRSCNRRKRMSVERFATQDAEQTSDQRSPHARPRARGETETETETETTSSSARETFVGRVQPSQRTGWLALLNGWSEGMGTPGGKAYTLEQIDAGLAEYLANEPDPSFSPRHVVRYVEAAANRKENEPAPKPRRAFGETGFLASIVAEAKQRAEGVG